MNNKKLIAIEIEFASYCCKDPFNTFACIPFEYIGTYQLNGLRLLGNTIEGNIPLYLVEQLAFSFSREYKGLVYCKWGELYGKYATDILKDFDRTIYLYHIYDDGNKDKITLRTRKHIKYLNDSDNFIRIISANKHGDWFIEHSTNNKINRIFPEDEINADDYIVGEMKYTVEGELQKWI